MPELSESDRAGAIQTLLDNPGWVRWLQPILMARMKQTMEGLAAGKSEDDDIKRGWFQALRWALNLPAQELETIKNSEREASKHADTDAEDEYRARFGYRSPFKRAPAPGETKGEDDTADISDTTSLPLGA